MFPSDGLTPTTPQGAKLESGQLVFMFAGNAYFTLVSQKTGTRYTYRISRAYDEVDGEKQYKNLWFVSLLTGPDNWANYSYIGLCGDGKSFRLTGKSKLPLESPPVAGFQYTLRHLLESGSTPGVEIWHAGKCGRCGRMLTVPESIACGFGPECIGKMEGM